MSLCSALEANLDLAAVGEQAQEMQLAHCCRPTRFPH
jgi:hypothetical protein